MACMGVCVCAGACSGIVQPYCCECDTCKVWVTYAMAVCDTWDVHAICDREHD